MKASFLKRLLILFTISILLPLMAFSIFLAGYFNHMFLQEDSRSYSNILYSASQNIRTYLDDLQRVSLTYNVYPDMMNMYKYINNGQYDSAANPLEYNETYNKYNIVIQNLLYNTRSDIEGVVFVPYKNVHKLYVCGRANTTLRVCNGNNAEIESWIDLAVKNKGTPSFSSSHQVSYYTGQSETVFSVICLIKDVYNHNEKIGILKVDMASDAIKNIIRNIKLSPNSSFQLLDQNNRVIYATQEIQGVYPEQIKDNTAIQTQADLYHTTELNIPQTNWKIALLLSDNDIHAQTNAIYYSTALVGLICFIVALFIFDLYSHRMVKPLRSILNTMKQVENGNLSVRADPVPADFDFNSIAVALNHMIDKLNVHINSEYKAVIKQRNAEYQALQAQINPHFLYNIFNGFIALNRMGKKQLLEDSIIQMTKIFRYTCTQNDMITIQEELDFIHQYLSLQKLRFEDRFTFQIDSDYAVNEIIIPKLLIQPLAENCIVHALEKCTHQLHIYVTAYTYATTFGNCIIITVNDDGTGLDVKNLKHCVGLKSVRERLELFNSESFFEIRSVPGKFTSCSVIFFPQKED